MLGMSYVLPVRVARLECCTSLSLDQVYGLQRGPTTPSRVNCQPKDISFTPFPTSVVSSWCPNNHGANDYCRLLWAFWALLRLVCVMQPPLRLFI